MSLNSRSCKRTQNPSSSLSLSLSLSHTHTHTNYFSLSHTLSFTLTLTNTLTPSHTHSRTLSHTRILLPLQRTTPPNETPTKPTAQSLNCHGNKAEPKTPNSCFYANDDEAPRLCFFAQKDTFRKKMNTFEIFGVFRQIQASFRFGSKRFFFLV